MAFDLDTYKRHVAPVQIDDVDFDAFVDQPLDPDSLRVLRYMHDVEHHTSCYLRNLLNTKAHHDPDVTTFLTLWSYEEMWHGEAIARVLAMHDEPAGAARVRTMRERLGWKLSASPLVWMGFSAITPSFLAVHMTFGVINEWTTQAGYARLRGLAAHPGGGTVPKTGHDDAPARWRQCGRRGDRSARLAACRRPCRARATRRRSSGRAPSDPSRQPRLRPPLRRRS
jgi:hypothetical protein